MKLLSKSEAHAKVRREKNQSALEAAKIADRLKKMRDIVDAEKEKVLSQKIQIEESFVDYMERTEQKRKELESEVHKLEKRKQKALEPLEEVKKEQKLKQQELEAAEISLKTREKKVEEFADELESREKIYKEVSEELEEKSREIDARTDALTDAELDTKELIISTGNWISEEQKKYSSKSLELEKKNRLADMKFAAAEQKLKGNQILLEKLRIKEQSVNDRYKTLLRAETEFSKNN